MTPLDGHLRARIAKHGPLSVQQFMEDALGHPEFGYYMTRDPFGEAGDFTTAPEVSQIFGELIGIWFASLWQTMGAPSPFHLIELGPGRGTLMSDALRAVKGVPGFHAAAQVSLIEMSSVLQDRQRKALSASGIEKIEWFRDLSQVPEGPTLVIANEFFDAMPVRQYVMTRSVWCERLIDIDPASNELSFVVAGGAAKPHLMPFAIKGEEGDIVEVSPPGLRVMHTLAARLAKHGGAGLIIDYGHVHSSVGETLQAVRGHKYTRVLDAPGEQDLTTHVDFEMLTRVAVEAGSAISGPVTQAAFLSRLGIDVRLQRLLGNAVDEDTATGLLSGVRRLIDRDAMGELFKVMAVHGSGVSSPVGFAN